MLYVIYNSNTDIDDFVTTSVTSALERAGELADQLTDIGIVNSDLYFVNVFDMNEDEYADAFVTDDDAVEKYTLRSFISTYGVAPVPEYGKERFHNLDQNEQLEVLKFIPDTMLVDEINRRFTEYRTYADAIREAGDRMRIYV